jgi:hypothetical protein
MQRRLASVGDTPKFCQSTQASLVKLRCISTPFLIRCRADRQIDSHTMGLVASMTYARRCRCMGPKAALRSSSLTADLQTHVAATYSYLVALSDYTVLTLDTPLGLLDSGFQVAITGPRILGPGQFSVFDQRPRELVKDSSKAPNALQQPDCTCYQIGCPTKNAEHARRSGGRRTRRVNEGSANDPSDALELLMSGDIFGRYRWWRDGAIITQGKAPRRHPRS